MVHFFYQKAKRFGPKRAFFSCTRVQKTEHCSVFCTLFTEVLLYYSHRRLFCFLYSCATEEGPFGAETFCLLVKKVYHVFNAQVIPPLSMSRRGNESLFYQYMNMHSCNVSHIQHPKHRVQRYKPPSTYPVYKHTAYRASNVLYVSTHVHTCT